MLMNRGISDIGGENLRPQNKNKFIIKPKIAPYIDIIKYILDK